MNCNGVILWSLLVIINVTLSKDTDCYRGSTASYTGTWNITQDGKTCQRWDSQTPHEHGWYKMKYFPTDAAMGLNLSDINNYCRDTEDEGKFWCFTTDPDIKWGYCDVPRCPLTSNRSSYVASSTTVPPFSGISTDPNDDTVTTFASTETTIVWTSEITQGSNDTAADSSESTIINGNRNKTKDICYYGSTRLYTGTWNTTQYGQTCQRWDSQTPHSHEFNNMKYFPVDEKMGFTLYEMHNYCRDTENEERVWCFTTDPDVVWEYCDPPRCPIISSTEITIVRTSISLNERTPKQGSDNVAVNLLMICQNIIFITISQIMIT